MFCKMKKLKLLLIMTSCVLLTGAIFPGKLFAETVIEEWVARYDGPTNYHDYANAIAVDTSGNVYVTGQSGGIGTAEDYATIKYAPDGTQLWAARYNGPGDFTDVAHAIAVDNSGNVYVTGYSIGSGTSRDYATIKYAPNGNELWVRMYNGPGNSHDIARAIAVDTSGNVYVTGHWGYATVKYDTDGIQLWVARYEGGWANAIAVDTSGNVYVTGFSEGSVTRRDYTTVKYSQPAPAPTWPEGSTLTASGVGLTSLTLTWTPAVHDVSVAEYRLFQDGGFIGTIPGTETTCQVTGLVSDTEYAFKVEACDGQGYCSTDGPSLTVRTLTPVGATQQLIDDVVALDLKGLVGKLNDAIKVLTDANPNNDGAAVNKLNDFINQVNGKADKISDAGGDPYALIDAAEAIIAMLEAG